MAQRRQYTGAPFGQGVRQKGPKTNTISKREFDRRSRQGGPEAWADLPRHTYVEGDEGGEDLSLRARNGRMVKSPRGQTMMIADAAERDYYLRRMSAEEVTRGMDGQYEYPSQMDGEMLRSSRHDAFNRDKQWRDEFKDFERCYQLMDTTGEDTDDDDVPAQNQIRRVAEDSISVMAANFPGATLAPTDPIEPSMEDELYRQKAKAQREAARNMDRAVRGVEKVEDDQSLTSDVVWDAVVGGVGYKMVKRSQRANVRETPGLQRLLQKDMKNWTQRDWDLHKYYADRPKIECIPPEQIVWQANVRDWQDQSMLRVHRARTTNVKWLRDQYQDPHIAPGTGTFAMDTSNDVGYYYNQKRRAPGSTHDPYDSPSRRGQDQAGFLETWELEPFVAEKGTQFFMGQGGPNAQATRKIWVDDVQMVYTAITTDRLLEKRIIPSDEGVMELPPIPHYIKISRQHPYGFSVVRMLYWAQVFINHMRSLTFQQAENNAMRMIAIMMDKLGADDDPQEIARTLKENGVLPIEGNRNMNNITEAVQALNFGNQGVNAALGQMINSEKQSIDREGQTVDQNAMSSARSARGKQVQMAAADRPKNHAGALLADAEEKKKERIYRHLQQIYGDVEDAMIPAPGVPTPEDPFGPMAKQKEPEPGDETIRFNKPERVAVVNTDTQGNPIKLPQLQSPQNPQGIAYERKTIVKNDVWTEMHALADGRGGLPTDPLQKLNYFMALGQGGLLLSKRTARQYVLPEQLKAVDDAYAAEDRKQQMQQQKAMMAQMLQEEAQKGNIDPENINMDAAQQAMPQGVPGGGPFQPQKGQNGEAPSDMAPSPGEQMRQQREDARVMQ